MAEFAIVSSIIQIVDVGIRLSLKLYTFGETIADAGTTVLSISKDVSLTSSVLKELAQNLERDKEGQISSEDAIHTAEEIVQECLKVFHEIDLLLAKTMKKVPPGGRSNANWITVRRKIKWSFMQPKMQLLRSNLDKLKATLLLMLNVLTYARHLSERSQQNSQSEHQRNVIEDLARSRDEYTRKFDNLTRAIMVKPPRREDDGVSRPTLNPQAKVFPEPLHSSTEQDSEDIDTFELRVYGDLINKLFEGVIEVNTFLEPLLWRRIYDDIGFLHCREIGRFAATHGRDRLRLIMTGLAHDFVDWDTVREAYKAFEVMNSQASMQSSLKRSKPSSSRSVSNLDGITTTVNRPYSSDRRPLDHCKLQHFSLPGRTSHEESQQGTSHENEHWDTSDHQSEINSGRPALIYSNISAEWNSSQPCIIPKQQENTNHCRTDLMALSMRRDAAAHSASFELPPPPVILNSKTPRPDRDRDTSNSLTLAPSIEAQSDQSLSDPSQDSTARVNRFEYNSGKEYQTVDPPENIVDTLLRKWTLVPRLRVSGI